MAEVQTEVVKAGIAGGRALRALARRGVLRDWGSVEREQRLLDAFVADQTQQVALIARHGSVPVGTCLLVPSEIDPNHQVSPWLAGLFVVPAHRRCGAGAVLVRAIEEQARRRGFAQIFLYTTSAASFYQRLGWELVEQTDWKGFDTAFMSRTL